MATWQFVLSFDSRKDRLWLAELDGRIVGSVAIVGRADNAAQLRWFLVHPDCRGQGLGRTLLDEALRFCHECGFRLVYLWTFSELTAAAHLYRDAGFRRTELKTHRIWGRMITEERYDLLL
jgi:ribosomal protein S18 acetylase RimI-like enzyme